MRGDTELTRSPMNVGRKGTLLLVPMLQITACVCI